MGDWHFTKQEEEILAKCLALGMENGDILSLDEEKLAQNILDELNQ